MSDFEKTVVRLKDSGALQRAEVRPEEDRQSIWRYLLILMMVVLVAESFVARRTAYERHRYPGIDHLLRRVRARWRWLPCTRVRFAPRLRWRPC